MDTQVTERVVSFWVQIAPLVVLAAVVCALAARYIWRSLRQLGNIRRDPLRLIFAEQLSTADLSARLSLND